MLCMHAGVCACACTRERVRACARTIVLEREFFFLPVYEAYLTLIDEYSPLFDTKTLNYR